ncbi:unnamed protein product [Soboliphyme baturini]|uniref:Uncharacterized protein n=1 Tax=Soboliphyme baturini TaxID=241478 RepID=A0A183IRP9_9BILA|nr:unnamed protein product [Soboliphyme baturini]
MVRSRYAHTMRCSGFLRKWCQRRAATIEGIGWKQALLQCVMLSAKWLYTLGYRVFVPHLKQGTSFETQMMVLRSSNVVAEKVNKGDNGNENDDQTKLMCRLYRLRFGVINQAENYRKAPARVCDSMPHPSSTRRNEKRYFSTPAQINKESDISRRSVGTRFLKPNNFSYHFFNIFFVLSFLPRSSPVCFVEIMPEVATSPLASPSEPSTSGYLPNPRTPLGLCVAVGSSRVTTVASTTTATGIATSAVADVASVNTTEPKHNERQAVVCRRRRRLSVRPSRSRDSQLSSCLRVPRVHRMATDERTSFVVAASSPRRASETEFFDP